MKAPIMLWMAIVVGFAIAAGAAFHVVDQHGRGLFFLIWKSVGGRAHGGRCENINNVCIYYETYGAGRPVLVLHGGLGSLNSMSYQIMALAPLHFVIGADSRGHGRSTDTSEPLSYSLMADDMLKLLDRLQIDRVDIVGWSDGAIIGLDLAMRHPERVRKLVAISANYDVDGLIAIPGPVAEIPSEPLSYRFFAPDPGHWPTLYRKVMTMQQTQPHYTLQDLSRIKAPTLVMAGEFDLIKREHTALLAKAISGSHEVIITHASHAAPFEQPEIVNRHILKFLDE